MPSIHNSKDTFFNFFSGNEYFLKEIKITLFFFIFYLKILNFFKSFYFKISFPFKNFVILNFPFDFLNLFFVFFLFSKLNKKFPKTRFFQFKCLVFNKLLKNFSFKRFFPGGIVYPCLKNILPEKLKCVFVETFSK